MFTTADKQRATPLLLRGSCHLGRTQRPGTDGHKPSMVCSQNALKSFHFIHSRHGLWRTATLQVLSASRGSWERWGRWLPRQAVSEIPTLLE